MCLQAMLIIGFQFSIGNRTFCCVLLTKKAMFMLQELNMKNNFDKFVLAGQTNSTAVQTITKNMMEYFHTFKSIA